MSLNLTADDILGITKKVTKEWTKQRKSEERGNRSQDSRGRLFSKRVDFTDVAGSILPGAYEHASGGGRYTVEKRQFFYAARDKFLEMTGREITANYFSQTVLVQFMNRHPVLTADWKITASPRGTLSIPNTGYDLRIPCGTIAIDEHIQRAGIAPDQFDVAANVSIQWPSVSEGQRYQAVLYIEKEGFEPQLREARIADRFDLAIISCKGQSVVAARRFADHACRVNGGVPLLIAHDLDKAGFEISMRMTTVSEHAREHDLVKYEFENDINVTDIGLRLEDARKYSLKDEKFKFKGGFEAGSIATPEEQAFLRTNRRVELNAFTAPQFIEWLESKLVEQGLNERLIPPDEILTAAYRRAIVLARVNAAIEEALDSAIREAKAVAVPKTLRGQLRKALSGSSNAWDAVLYSMTRSKLYPECGK